MSVDVATEITEPTDTKEDLEVGLFQYVISKLGVTDFNGSLELMLTQGNVYFCGLDLNGLDLRVKILKEDYEASL